MKNIKVFFLRLFTGILLFSFAFSFSIAAENEENEFEKEKFNIKIPHEIEEFMPDDLMNIDVKDLYKSFDFHFFSGAFLKILATAVPEAVRNFSVLLGLLIVSACLETFRRTMVSSSLGATMELLSMLCIAGAAFSVTETVFDLSEKFITSLSSCVTLMAPTMAALLVASGNVTSATVLSGLITCALSLLETIMAGWLFPMIRISLCLSLISSVFDVSGLAGTVPIIKKLIGYVFGFVTFCLSAVLTFQGIIAKSTDSFAVKGIQFAAGSFIPVVGGAVKEAISTVVSGIGMVKSATGVIGAVTVCLLASLPVIQILVHKLFLELLSVCAGVLGLRAQGKLLDDISSFLGYSAAVMAISGLFFILALSLMASIGT